MKRNAKITFGGAIPSCFASLSWPLLTSQDSSGLNIIQVDTESGESHYLSVVSSGGQKQGGEQLKIHSKLGVALGLKEGQDVGVTHYSGTIITPVQSANVVCVSSDDWEILESNTDAVINGLLNQLRVVYPGQKFPFWVTKSLQINLKIESLHPTVKDFGILTANSEIIVPTLSSPSSGSHPFSHPQSAKLFRLRVHPITIPDSILCTFPTSSLLIKNTRNAFIFRKSLENNGSSSPTLTQDTTDCDPYFYAQLLLHNNVSIAVKVFLLELSGINPELLQKYFWTINPPCVYLHPELVKEFDIEVKSHLWIRHDLEKAGVSCSDEDKSLLAGKMCLLGNSDVKSLLPFHTESSVKVFDSLLHECQCFIEESLSLGGRGSHQMVGPNNGSLLIEGKPGSGKTMACSTLAKRLQGPPYHVYCEIISCSKWRGKKPERIELKTVLEKAASMQPSLIFLDDLDVITPVGMAQQENLQEQFLHFKICETIRESLLAYGGQQICVVATVKSREVLNPYWKSRQGFHFFHKTVFIPPPNAVERLHIFESCLARYKFSLEKISKLKNDVRFLNLLKSIHEQYATPRLISMVARKFVAASFPSRDSGQEEDLNTDLDNLEALILDEINFCDMEGKIGKNSSVANVKWENVGGLHQIKKDLVKILQWPIKYKHFFQNAPIKLPSGILLYGYPGTGKTLLGLAIPSLVNTKFIHIKGPELLSKYIGASEQAVQDVFKRARNSSPCVIFFDEFDSLVPRRGHDSTGVTDRVVNQFLAEMDGIEGGLGQMNSIQDIGESSYNQWKQIEKLENTNVTAASDTDNDWAPKPRRCLSLTDGSQVVYGLEWEPIPILFINLKPGVKQVYLVGATSRPDLIDPAVLRPGRLDKHLFFDLPTKDERQEILEHLGSQVNLDLSPESNSSDLDNPNLDAIIYRMKGLTGADIHSLVCSAQLSAVQRYLGKLGADTNYESTTDKQLLPSTSQEQKQQLWNKDLTPSDIPVKVGDLLEAFSNFRPSLHGEELARFQNIYEAFSNGDTRQQQIPSTGKRATLA